MVSEINIVAHSSERIESPEFVRSSFIDSGVGLLRIDKKETERNRDQEMLVSSLQPDLEFFHQFFSWSYLSHFFFLSCILTLPHGLCDGPGRLCFALEAYPQITTKKAA